MAIGTMAAVAIGAGALGLGSAISAKSQSKAAGKAADTSLAVAQQNNALARDIYGQNKSALSPYMNAGKTPVSLMGGALGFGNSSAYRRAFGNFIENSDYGFQMAEGGNAINSGYAGAGTVNSGAAMKALEQYRQNLQQGYRGEYNSLLANQQALGLGGASALAGVGQNYVNTISANNNNAGSAAANAYLVKGQNNPFGAALGSFGGSFLSGAFG